jgi:hypothetical protein
MDAFFEEAILRVYFPVRASLICGEGGWPRVSTPTTHSTALKCIGTALPRANLNAHTLHPPPACSAWLCRRNDPVG